MNDRAALYIDIEGFSHLYHSEDNDSLWGLCDLMEGVYIIGSNASSLASARLFAYQTGDGFIIIDDSGPPHIERLLGVGIALCQFTLIKAHHFCKATLDCGGMADIFGCYPKVIKENRTNHGAVRMGEGLMTIFPVMGTALINTVKLSQKSCKCSAVVLASSNRSSCGDGINYLEQDGRLYVDWIHGHSEQSDKARKVLGLENVTAGKLTEYFERAVVKNKCKPDWLEMTRKVLNLNAVK